MNADIVTSEDMNYLVQQSSSNLNMILSGMVALLSDNDTKVTMLENQTWFQRMCRTISGKNKMTQQEIQRNHDKINAYMTQAMTELYEQQCIDRQIMISLGNQLNELYVEHLHLKQILGAFVGKINEKIESIDNFHMLNTEIEQGIYSSTPSIISICKILSQLDKRCIQDYRKMNILQRTMIAQNILSNNQINLTDYLMSIVEIPMEEVGQIYIELSTIRGNFMANIILNMIENYHFLPDLARKMKNKALLVGNVIEHEQLEPTMLLSSCDIYDDLISSKLDMLEGLLPISEIQYDVKLAEAEQLYLEYKLDEAFEIFKTLAEKGNGRAMYFMGEYYCWVGGTVKIDQEQSMKWRSAGHAAGDILASLNYAYTMSEENPEKKDIFNRLFDKVLLLAENGDVFAQDELWAMYGREVDTENDKDKLLYWLESSANAGYWRAQYGLAEYYFELEEDDKAFFMLMKSANIGFSWAQHMIGRYYSGDLCKIDINYQEANKWYIKAAEQGYAFSMLRLGTNYYTGKGITKDYVEAVKWWKKAAELGNTTATLYVGEAYKDGEGVNQDFDEALKYFHKAYELGSGDAANWIGIMYDKGFGVCKDYEQAFIWFKHAAEMNNLSGQFNLAVYYKNGKGTPTNIEKAKEWVLKSAEQGYESSIENAQKWFGIIIK